MESPVPVKVAVHKTTPSWPRMPQRNRVLVRPNSEKITNRQALKNPENSNGNGFYPNLVTMTKLSAGFTATLKRTSSLFEVQLRSRILRCPRMLVFFAVLLTDCEEWFCSLAGFLPGARRAIVCILFLLEQSQVVD